MRLASVAFLLAVVSACSSANDSTPAASSVDAGPSDAGTSTDIDAEPLAPAPAFRIEEEAEAPCVVTTSAPAKAIVPNDVALGDLDVAGDRLVARTITGESAVVFDRNGKNASAPVALDADARIVGTSTGWSAVSIDPISSMLVLRRFDTLGNPSGATQPLGPIRGGRAFTIARGSTSTAAVWVSPPSDLQVRIVDDAGPASAPIRLEDGANAAAFDDLSVVAARTPSTTDASEYLVVWSLRRIALASYRVYAALVGRNGVVGLVRLVFGDDARITLAKVVAHEGGATLLANRDGEPLVVPLDAYGRAASAARLFKGARDRNLGGGQGLAFANGRLALVATHASGAHALRAIDVDAKPQAGWTCLDAPAPDAFHAGSVIADGTGWRVLVATTTGSALLDVDATGAGAR